MLTIDMEMNNRLKVYHNTAKVPLKVCHNTTNNTVYYISGFEYVIILLAATETSLKFQFSSVQ